MQLNGVGQIPQGINNQSILNEVSTGSAEGQIKELEKEIDRLMQKRACPVADLECNDETGPRPDIAEKAKADLNQKIRQEIDQKIQQLQQKIQQLRNLEAGKTENRNNVNKTNNADDAVALQERNNQNNSQTEEISTDELKKMGVVGEFIDEKV